MTHDVSAAVLRVPQVAARLDTSSGTVYRLIREGHLLDTGFHWVSDERSYISRGRARVVLPKLRRALADARGVRIDWPG